MPKKRFSVEQIISHLREAEVFLAQGQTIGQVCQHIGISEQSYYRWRREYSGLKVDQARRLKELGRENTRLRRDVAGGSAVTGSATERHGFAHTVLSLVHHGSRPRGSGAGLGVREGAMITAFGLIGVPSEGTLVLSIMYGLMGLLLAVPGGIVWRMSTDKKVEFDNEI